MRRLPHAMLLASLYATGVVAQDDAGSREGWIEVPLDSDYVVLSIQSDRLELGQATSAWLQLTAPAEFGLVVEAIESSAEDLRIEFVDPTPVEVPPGSSRAARLRIVPDPPEFLEFFTGTVDSTRVGSETHKLTIHLQAGGKPADETTEITLHAGLSSPRVRAILFWGFLGILLGFGVKRLGLWQARLVAAGWHPANAPAVAPPGGGAAGQPAAAVRGARLSLAIDLLITALLGSMAILLTHVQEPNHFTSLFAAFMMGLVLGGLTDDQLRQRLFSAQGAI